MESKEVVQLYLLMRASRCFALHYAAELRSPDTIARLSVPPLDWAAAPRPKTPARSSTSGSDGDLPEERDDLDMGSVSANSSSGPGNPVQEAEWEEEWRASYKEAIDTVGQSTLVHFSSMKRCRSPESKDRVLDYFRRSEDADATDDFNEPIYGAPCS